jgi:hypothetical protein
MSGETEENCQKFSFLCQACGQDAVSPARVWMAQQILRSKMGCRRRTIWPSGKDKGNENVNNCEDPCKVDQSCPPATSILYILLMKRAVPVAVLPPANTHCLHPDVPPESSHSHSPLWFWYHYELYTVQLRRYMNMEIRNTGTATLHVTVYIPYSLNNQQAYEQRRFEYILSFSIPTLTTYTYNYRLNEG